MNVRFGINHDFRFDSNDDIAQLTRKHIENKLVAPLQQGFPDSDQVTIVWQANRDKPGYTATVLNEEGQVSGQSGFLGSTLLGARLDLLKNLVFSVFNALDHSRTGFTGLATEYIQRATRYSDQ